MAPTQESAKSQHSTHSVAAFERVSQGEGLMQRRGCRA